MLLGQFTCLELENGTHVFSTTAWKWSDVYTQRITFVPLKCIYTP